MNFNCKPSLLILVIMTFSGLLFSTIANAQAPTGIYVFMKEKKAYREIRVTDSTGVIDIKDSLNGKIVLRFPDGNPIPYSIQFNSKTKKFLLAFQCSGDSCLQIYPSDMENNEVPLTFIGNNLVAVGKRLLSDPKPITDKQPYIKLIVNKGEKPKDIYDTLMSVKEKQQMLLLDSSKISAYKFYCGTFKCKKCDDHKDSTHNELFKEASYRDLYHQVFGKEKVSSTYWIVYDNRNGRNMTVNYFKITNDNNLVKVKKTLRPRVGRQATITVIGPKDTSFYTINGTATQYFEEQEANISDLITGVVSPPKPQTKEKEEKKTPDKPTTNSEDNLEMINLDVTNINSDLLSTMSKSVVQMRAKTDIPNEVKSLLDKTDSLIKEVKKLNEQKVILEKHVRDLRQKNENMRKQLNNIISQLKACEDSLKQLKTNIDNAAKEKENYPTVVALAEKYYALERDMEIFLADHDDISFEEDQYKTDRTCLQLKIKELIGIPVPQSATDLAKLLIDRVTLLGLKAHYHEFASLIKQIEFNYKAIMTLKPSFWAYSIAKTIDNADEYTLSIKSPKGNDFGINSSFNTSWGCKIDISTGVYLSGLRNNNIVLAPHIFSYKEGRDSIGPDGAAHRIYTGKIIDTTGNLIQENNPRLSYSAGFLVHVYPRIGGFVNFGGVTGITITNSNSSPIQLMLGVSAMFKAGKSRLSLSGGLIFGQVKALSSVAAPYHWDDTPDKTVFDSKSDLPIFYTGSSDLPTYDRWKHSLFVGLSYNFASFNIGNKE